MEEPEFVELFVQAYTKHISGTDPEKCRESAMALLEEHDSRIKSSWAKERESWDRMLEKLFAIGQEDWDNPIEARLKRRIINVFTEEALIERRAKFREERLAPGRH